MKTNCSKTALGMLAALAFAASANAAYILGDVTFAGNATLTPSSPSSATSADFLNPGFVVNANGVFAAEGLTTGSVVTFTSTTWDFNYGPGSIDPFWSAGPFSFALTSSTLVSQGTNFIDVVGTGVISAPGYDDTMGFWTFNISTTNPQGSTFSFQSSTSGSPERVPDGGTTLLLLGVGLLGLHGARKKFAK